MLTLEFVFRGGGASRLSSFYRWLTRILGRERVEAIHDTCQLRATIITAVLRVALVAIFGALVLGLILFIGWSAIDAFIQEGLVGVWADFDMAVLLIVVLVVGSVFAAWIGSKSPKLGRVVWFLVAVAMIGSFMAVFSEPSYDLGVIVGRSFSENYPEIYPAEVYGDLEQDPVRATALGGGIFFLTAVAVGVTGTAAFLLLSGIWQLWNLFRVAIGRTDFWAWLRGRLCHEFSWIG